MYYDLIMVYIVVSICFLYQSMSYKGIYTLKSIAFW
jgi:hypothetical protein